jgi:hypothetical protein
MGKQLVVISGLERGRVLKLDETDIVQLGCSQTLEIHARFRDPQVARVHCEVQVEGDRVIVIDADTPNGTYLNGKRIRQEELRPGDVIRIGNTELKYLTDAGADPNSSSATLRKLESKPSTGKPSPGSSFQVPALGSVPRQFDPGLSSAEMPAFTSDSPDAKSADRLSLLVGRTFAHYKVELALGIGHWGRVFRAQDIRAHHLVALKVLRPDFGADELTVQRFAQALRTVLPLRHPNLINHFGAGKAGPFCWISMEYCEGKSASQVIRRIASAGRLDWRYSYRVAVQLARALEFIHRHQVVHGNMTPQDVLIRGTEPQVKLGDLMLACTLKSLLVQPLGAPAQRKEDLAYLSPEATSEAADVDQRSDIYSAGAVVYALLTGHPPFEASSPADLIAKIRRAEPFKPRKLQPNVHAHFEETLLQMLAKRPEDRFQDATELVAQLERLGRWASLPEAKAQG